MYPYNCEHKNMVGQWRSQSNLYCSIAEIDQVFAELCPFPVDKFQKLLIAQIQTMDTQRLKYTTQVYDVPRHFFRIYSASQAETRK